MEHLKREVGLFGATMYCLGVIIGAGVYVLIGAAANMSGNALWLSFLIACVIAGFAGIAYAELTSMMPRDAAEYVYFKRGFKKESLAFVIGWVRIIASIIAGATVSMGFGSYLSSLIGVNETICAVFLIILLVALNMIGMKQTIWVDISLVAFTILGLLFVIFSGIDKIGAVDYMVMPFGLSGVFSAAALIFFAYLGFENISNLGEEAKHPKRTLPLALIISLSVAAVLYILVAIVSVSVVPWQQLASAQAPLSLVMQTTWGTNAGLMISIFALFATASTVLGFFVSYSRMMYGMSEEKILPQFFMKLTKKSHVPYVTILLLAVVLILFVVSVDFVTVASLTDFGALFVFMMVNLVLIVLRYKEPDAERKFKIPFSIGKFPIIPGLGILMCLFLMFHLEHRIWLYGVGILVSGYAVYYLIRKKR